MCLQTQVTLAVTKPGGVKTDKTHGYGTLGNTLCPTDIDSGCTLESPSELYFIFYFSRFTGTTGFWLHV